MNWKGSGRKRSQPKRKKACAPSRDSADPLKLPSKRISFIAYPDCVLQRSRHVSIFKDRYQGEYRIKGTFTNS
jgi:hypothetical protein